MLLSPLTLLYQNPAKHPIFLSHGICLSFSLSLLYYDAIAEKSKITAKFYDTRGKIPFAPTPFYLLYFAEFCPAACYFMVYPQIKSYVCFRPSTWVLSYPWEAYTPGPIRAWTRVHSSPQGRCGVRAVVWINIHGIMDALFPSHIQKLSDHTAVISSSVILGTNGYLFFSYRSNDFQHIPYPPPKGPPQNPEYRRRRPFRSPQRP